MNYEEKLQERAEQMAKVKYWETEGDRIPDNAEIDERVKEMLPLAALSLQWSAEDFESGWNSRGERDEALDINLTSADLPERLIANGLKPPTDGE